MNAEELKEYTQNVLKSYTESLYCVMKNLTEFLSEEEEIFFDRSILFLEFETLNKMSTAVDDFKRDYRPLLSETNSFPAKLEIVKQLELDQKLIRIIEEAMFFMRYYLKDSTV